MEIITHRHTTKKLASALREQIRQCVWSFWGGSEDVWSKAQSGAGTRKARVLDNKNGDGGVP